MNSAGEIGHRRTTWWTVAAASLLAALLLLIGSPVARAQANQSGPSHTVLDGVFTAPQAARGATLYDAHCAECHDGADVDGPPLTGAPFIERWREDSLAGLFEFIKMRMPQQAPGSLAEPEYLAIVAHLLSENSFPAGSRELTTATTQDTLLVGPNGPRPLPSGALVAVVGCLTRTSDQEWVLARAGRPSRVRAGNEITAAEATAAAAAAPGTQTFALQNIGDAGSALSISGNGGQKVTVKGALTPRAPVSRIHVTAAKILADTCD